MTGLIEQSSLEDAENLELPVLLTKPFTGDELLRALHAALQPRGAAEEPKGA